MVCMKSLRPSSHLKLFHPLQMAPFLENFAFLCRTLASLMYTQRKAYFGDIPVPEGKILLLSLLDLNEGQSQNALAQVMSIKKSALAIALDQLAVDGLVEREQSTNDRRVKSVRLTDKGRHLAHQARESATRHNNDFLAPLTKDERQELLRLLNKLLATHQQSTSPGT